MKRVDDKGLKLGLVNPQQLGVKAEPFYRYIGSLTVPPCTEGIIWSVLYEVFIWKLFIKIILLYKKGKKIFYFIFNLQSLTILLANLGKDCVNGTNDGTKKCCSWCKY